MVRLSDSARTLGHAASILYRGVAASQSGHCIGRVQNTKLVDIMFNVTSPPTPLIKVLTLSPSIRSQSQNGLALLETRV